MIVRVSLILVTVAIITTVAAVIITIVPGGYKNINSMMSSAQTPNIESSPQVVGSHTPGYPITTTTGNILDPLQTSVDGNPANAVVDPMKYLREFSYGTVSGTWIGGFLYSPLAAVIFLSVGAGEIFQVVYSLLSWISHHQKPKSSPYLRTSCCRIYCGTTNNVLYGITYMKDG